MRLMSNIFDIKLTNSTECELSSDYYNSILLFYDIYRFACNVVGFIDSNMKKKDILQSQLISSNDFNNSAYNKLVVYSKQDMMIINKALEIIESKKNEVGYFGTLDYKGLFAVSIYDDN